MNSQVHSRLCKVSVGLPVFNGERLIADSIKSLLAQTHTNFELIVMDNASTDGTAEICKVFAAQDSRIHYIRQHHNVGAGPNFKAVLDASSCDYFMWAAHDDLWDPDYIASAVDLLADPGVEFVLPLFRLTSIRFGLYKNFKREVFDFIESTDVKHRTISYLCLHYLSLSVNIVYSMFRKSFLKAIWEMQDISNEGAMGALIVNRGRGAVNTSKFSKRYMNMWPGRLQILMGLAGPAQRRKYALQQTINAIEYSRETVKKFFPEYVSEIDYIYDRYKPYDYGQSYRICKYVDVVSIR